MKHSVFAASALGAALAAAQEVTWCTDSDCGDCPSGLTTSGPGYPECVIYDSEVVFGGQGFDEGTGSISYNVFGDFPDPCGGAAGSYMVRSPASLATVGCGNLVYHTEAAECSNSLPLRDTFMIQFCCGEGDCSAAGVPWGKRDGSSGGMRSARLKFANGTEIEPLAVGTPPDAQTMRRGLRSNTRRCEGYEEASYEANGDSYLATFDTQIVSNGVGAAQEEDRTVDIRYDQSVSFSTGFELSVGDPLGIVSASVNFEFETSETEGFTVSISVPAGAEGRVGFTPVYRCTKGTLLTCDGDRTPEQESCTPYIQNGLVQGDYELIQT